MRFLSIYTHQAKNDAPPTPELMAAMGKLIEEGMKAGWLLATWLLPPSVRLPWRERLRAEGLELTNHYTHSSPCSPSRASLWPPRLSPQPRAPRRSGALARADWNSVAAKSGWPCWRPTSTSA